jgi:hypothetical protein
MLSLRTLEMNSLAAANSRVYLYVAILAIHALVYVRFAIKVYAFER